MTIGLAVKVRTSDHPGGWREGWLDGFGQVTVAGKVVRRIDEVRHDWNRQMAHESPDPLERGWWALLFVIMLPEGMRRQIEAAAWPEFRDPGAAMERARAARAVTGTWEVATG